MGEIFPTFHWEQLGYMDIKVKLLRNSVWSCSFYCFFLLPKFLNFSTFLFHDLFVSTYSMYVHMYIVQVENFFLLLRPNLFSKLFKVGFISRWHVCTVQQTARIQLWFRDSLCKQMHELLNLVLLFKLNDYT